MCFIALGVTCVIISNLFHLKVQLISTEQMEADLIGADFRTHPVVQVVMEAHVIDAELELL